MDPLLEQKLNRLGERIKQRTRERKAQAGAAHPAPPPARVATGLTDEDSGSYTRLR